MRKLFFTSVLLLSLTFLFTDIYAGNPAATLKADRKKPASLIKNRGTAEDYVGGKIEVEPEEWDFGYAPGGSMLKHFYTIKNIGQDTLMITKVKPSCGCTSAPLNKDVLAPGESTILEVGFKTLKFKGKVKKNIKIYNSDPENSTKEIDFLSVVAKPYPLIKIRPKAVDFVQVWQGKNVKQKIDLTNISKSQVSFKIIDAPKKDYLKYKFGKLTLNPGEATDLEVRIGKNAPVGELQESITIETTGSEPIRISIPIRAEILVKK